MTATTADATGRVRNRSPATAGALRLRGTGNQPATCKAEPGREKADRRAIERGEDEGLAIHKE